MVSKLPHDTDNVCDTQPLLYKRQGVISRNYDVSVLFYDMLMGSQSSDLIYIRGSVWTHTDTSFFDFSQMKREAAWTHRRPRSPDSFVGDLYYITQLERLTTVINSI